VIVHDLIDFIVAPLVVGAICWCAATLVALKIAMEKRVTFAEQGVTVQRLFDEVKNLRERMAVIEDWRKSNQ
jgi:hypothetical protein